MSASIVAKLEERTEHHEARIDLAHERISAAQVRISSLEKWRYGLMGALAFASLQSSVATALLIAYWKSKT